MLTSVDRKLRITIIYAGRFVGRCGGAAISHIVDKRIRDVAWQKAQSLQINAMSNRNVVNIITTLEEKYNG